MKVLFLTGACPYPPNSGGRMRSYNLLRVLARRHHITLITPVGSESVAEIEVAFDHSLDRVVAVPVTSPVTRLGRWAFTLRSLASDLPYIVRAHVDSRFAAAVSGALGDRSFDLLHCDSISAVYAVPAEPGLPSVYDAHNVEAVIWERYIREERRPYLLPVLKSQCAKVAAYEARLPRVFDWCVAVSGDDAVQMRCRYGFHDVPVVRNGVDTNYYRRIPDVCSERIVFIGSLDWRPNQDAVSFIIREILPIIRRELPNIEVLIVGRKPPSVFARKCRRAGVHLHADVSDVRPHLAGASVVVVPLRIGGGSRLKILEAMAAGRAVVSTTIGAEGLEVTPGRHLLIADSPPEFARAVVRALRDRDLRESLTEAGRALVETSYSWERVGEELERVWERAVSSPNRPSGR